MSDKFRFARLFKILHNAKIRPGNRSDLLFFGCFLGVGIQQADCGMGGGLLGTLFAAAGTKAHHFVV